MSEALFFVAGVIIGWVFSPRERVENNRGAFLRGQIYETNDPVRRYHLQHELKEVLRDEKASKDN